MIRAFVKAINARDWPRLDQLMAADFVRHSEAAGPPAVRSREQAKEFLRREYETFPDGRERLEDLVAEGDKIAVRHRFQGIQRGPMGPYPPTGKAMTSNYLAIYRLEDGKIAEAWVEWDNLSALVQLGHQKPPDP